MLAFQQPANTSPLDAALAPLPDPGDEESHYGPKRPLGWKRPPAPDWDDVQEDVAAERQDHAPRVSQSVEMLAWLNDGHFGAFDRDVPALAAGEVQRGVSTSLRNEHDLLVAHVASLDWAFKALYREAVDKEEAQAKEDFARYQWECAARAHAAAFGSATLRRTYAELAVVCGMLVTFVGPNPANDESGIDIRVVDPLTCFPVHEGARGLAAMARQYEADTQTVLAQFADLGPDVERKIRKLAGQKRSDNGRFTGRVNRRHRATVTEWWDREWVVVGWGDEELFTINHGQGRVPFKVTYGEFSQSSVISLPGSDGNDVSYGTTTDGTRFTLAGSGSTRAVDLARVCQPFLQRAIPSLIVDQSVVGRMLTHFQRAIDPPTVMKLTLESREDGGPEIDRSQGGRTVLGEEDAIDVLPEHPLPDIVTPLLALLGEDRAGRMSSSLLMQGPAPQTSGTAVDIFSSARLERWLPVPMMIERHVTDVTEEALAVARDFGEVLGNGRDELGTFYVPRTSGNPRSGTSRVHEVTPDLIERAGVRMEVTLRKFNLGMAAMVANSFTMLRNGGMISKRTAIELGAWTDDPDEELQRIRDEQLDEVPEVVQANTVAMLAQEIAEAVQRGDMESAAQLNVKMKYVTFQMDQNQMQKQMQTKAMQQSLQQDAMGGMPQNGAAGVPGPAMGLPPGGGRPPGPAMPQLPPGGM